MLILRQVVCQLIYQSKDLILLGSAYTDCTFFGTAGKSQEEVTNVSCPEFTSSLDVVPTLTVVWHGWYEGSAKLLGYLALKETEAKPPQRLIVQSHFASAGAVHPLVAWWVCQDTACLLAWPWLCQMWPEMLAAFGGGGFDIPQLCMQFLRSLLWQVKIMWELFYELASCFEKIISWDRRGCCLTSENLAANLLLLCISFGHISL